MPATALPAAPAPLATAAEAPGPALASPAARVPWSGVLGLEGTATGDGRLIETNALVWDSLPLPLRYVPVDTGAHDGAVVVGQIESLTRAGGQILGTGFFDLAAPFGEEAMGCVRDKRMDGVSMDLDDVSFEVRVRAELVQQAEADMIEMILGEPMEPEPLEPDADGRVTVATIGSDDELMVTTSARIRAATMVSIPAFDTARIALTGDVPLGVGAGDAVGVSLSDQAPAEGPAGSEDGPHMPGMMPDSDTPCSCTDGDPGYDPECVCPPADGSGPAQSGPSSTEVTASASRSTVTLEAPPAAWFANPRFRQATALRVTEDGRVLGHLAAWGTCHISHTHTGCVTPPRSAAGYAYFHTGSVLTDAGTEQPVGHITLDTRHAGPTLTAASAAAHYEHTGSVVADVAAGEDEFGIWVAGALRPTATESQVRALRAAPLSGDWRRISGNLELVAALAVNVPGFPVPRPKGLVAGGVTRSLVASGMLPPRRVRRPGAPGALSMDDLRYLKRLADRERAEEAQRSAGSLSVADQLARRVRASALAVRAHRPL